MKAKYFFNLYISQKCFNFMIWFRKKQKMQTIPHGNYNVQKLSTVSLSWPSPKTSLV